MKRKTLDEVIQKFIEKHKNKYDYSNVQYVNCDTKVCIICPEHGEFWQTPYNHMKGQECPLCSIRKSSIKKRTTNEGFIDKAKNVHSGKYDYSKTNYGKNNNEKVCIICPEHGEFWQTPSNHLRGEGCPICRYISSSKSNRYNDEIFIEKAKNVHSGKYDYSKVNYVNSKTKVCIICPEHGEFWQNPDSHIQGMGCPKCAGKQKTTNEFVALSRLIHHNRYDYSVTKYCGVNEKVKIICSKHGEFLQNPTDHLCGCGCPKCSSSHMETEIRNLLMSNNVNFEEQKKFDWLGLQSLDFYLPDHNIAIECQGIQHFEAIVRFGGNNALNETIQRDQNKRQLCEENDVKLLYYANYDYDFPYEVITEKNKLYETIKKYE